MIITSEMIENKILQAVYGPKTPSMLLLDTYSYKSFCLLYTTEINTYCPLESFRPRYYFSRYVNKPIEVLAVRSEKDLCEVV